MYQRILRSLGSLSFLFFIYSTAFGAAPRYGRLTVEQEALAAQVRPLLQERLEKERIRLGLSQQDVTEWVFSDIHSSAKTNTTYAYLQQQHRGIRVFNAVSAASIIDGNVRSFSSRFITSLAEKATQSSPALDEVEALRKAIVYLGLPLAEIPVVETRIPALSRTVFDGGALSSEKIIVTLYYLPVEDRVSLVWNVSIAPKGQKHWWNLRFDAATGDFVDKNDWNVSCDFENVRPTPASDAAVSTRTVNPGSTTSNSMLPVYNVFPFPLEAPSFGPRVLLSNPADITASPYGWHDTNGAPGEEYTTTQGNNVFAYDDIANQDAPGNFADGGATLNFDFPINFSQSPSTYLEASLTNLFYVNNRVHDVLYHYGFDEPGGNFQVTNYSGQGAGNDQVLAEGQDGGGTNNANFATPDDGQNGRMQMYLWSGASQASMQVNAPSSIAGAYVAIEAGFGPVITAPITNDFVLVDDGTAPVTDACDPIQNGSSISGKIAVIDRGTCTFISKVNAAEAQGAIAVIVINNQAGSPISMGGTGTSNIPAVMISQADGNTLKSVLSSGGTVNGTLNPPAVVNQDLDGSLDNGIVAHEFGHGVSNRLTGGPNNSNCLYNGEQGGEGWSDYFALLFTIEPGDAAADARGIGTYALNESVNGSGIRRYPYSTDMSVNPQTYADLATSSEVHDIGEIWCVTLWDLTWALIDQFGFDNDWINGTGGNNIALRLVMEGMKLQPCGPGFLDGRDAILAADDNLYGGIHKCLIWSVFARRGMGSDALQGSANTAGDETAGYALPSFCQTPTSAPTADFVADVTTTCSGIVRFTDQSTDIAQAWSWDFGDGSTAITQNPTHTYMAPGVYTVSLLVTNVLGSDSLVRSGYITVTMPPSPTVNGSGTFCIGSSVTMNAILAPGDDARWSSSTGTVVAYGSSYTTPPITANTTYYVRQFTPTSLQNVGPVNASFGGGGYHNTGFEGRELFTTYVPLRIKSVWVDASGTADRTFNLYGPTGALVTSAVINVPAGQSRVLLDFDIPVPGNYQFGVTAGSNLYRNNNGASYPYTLSGLLSITASNSTTSPSTYYYYVYDWQVQELPCLSEPAALSIEVSPDPVASFNVTDAGLSCTFIDNSTGNIVSYSWDFGDGSTSGVQNPQHTYAQAGSYVVTLTVTTADGCTSTSSQSVTLSVSGLNDAGKNMIVVTGGSQQLSITLPETFDQDLTVKVLDVAGRELVVRNGFRSGTNVVPLPAAVNAVVMVMIESGGETIVKRVFLSE